ncbi:MAG: hypothetical protein JSU73_06265 [candidate division WOR-3 bacterium]|nr:MAG: hypothetical protein JSU73_06265 [candidate division WOR-3 bacterium]
MAVIGSFVRKLCAVLLLVASAAEAGPVGRYLGYEVGVTHTSAHAGQESIHVIFPLPYDTVVAHAWDDTVTVQAETIIQGSPAWVFRRVRVQNGATVSFDTAYESGDTLLLRESEFAGIELQANAYLVPFDTGSWWRTGLEGTYYIDINGDSLTDTVTVWGDTTRVVGIEDVALPGSDTVRDCYKLLTVARQSLSMQESTFQFKETSFVRMYEWYKDSLWLIKDSLDLTARVYIWLIIWIHAADAFGYDVGMITSLPTGLSSPIRHEAQPELRAQPNPFRTSLELQALRRSATGFRIHDAAGRLVRTLPGSKAVWDGRDRHGKQLPPGVYLICTPSGTIPVTRLDR